MYDSRRLNRHIQWYNSFLEVWENYFFHNIKNTKSCLPCCKSTWIWSRTNIGTRNPSFDARNPEKSPPKVVFFVPGWCKICRIDLSIPGFRLWNRDWPLTSWQQGSPTCLPILPKKVFTIDSVYWVYCLSFRVFRLRFIFHLFLQRKFVYCRVYILFVVFCFIYFEIWKFTCCICLLVFTFTYELYFESFYI